MTGFSYTREQEFLGRVQEARDKLSGLREAMQGVRLTASREEEIYAFFEGLNAELYRLERRCIKNLNR